ncbi:MAG: pyruvate formate-lyase-activating protein [Kiritimatiellia bacterium]
MINIKNLQIENAELKGRIHSVESFGTLDGPGIRYILFLQGCFLKCLYCHNPDSRPFNCGKETSVQDVVNDISNYMLFIKKGGVTLSGGEPLAQPEFSLAVIKACRLLGLHTAVDTSGAVPLKQSRNVIQEADLLLLDIKSVSDKISRKLTGQSNHNTLASLEFCEGHHKDVWVRHVLVPGWTMDAESLNRLADHILRYECIKKVELLPYHKMGIYKWKQMGIPYPLKSVEPPSEEEIEIAKDVFRQRRLM